MQSLKKTYMHLIIIKLYYNMYEYMVNANIFCIKFNKGAPVIIIYNLFVQNYGIYIIYMQ